MQTFTQDVTMSDEPMAGSETQGARGGPRPVSRTDCLQFLPRPVLLRQLSQARSVPVEDLSQHLAQLARSFSVAQSREHARTTTSSARGGFGFHSPAGTSCDNPLSPDHDLVCGHVVSTPFDPYLQEEKSSCGPNCMRYSLLYKSGLSMEVFKKVSPQPFICQVCLGEYVARYRVGIGMHYGQHGWNVPANEEEQIKLFTYHIMRRCVEHYGMRMSKTDNRSGTPWKAGEGGIDAEMVDSAAATNAAMANFGPYREARAHQNGPATADGEAAIRRELFAENVGPSGDNTLDGLTDQLLDVKIGEATDDIIAALTTDITSLSM